MDYALVKTIHQSAVTLSFIGFFARGLGSLLGARWTQTRVARSVPHVVDTVLLVSAITLATLLRLNPLTTPWLATKIVALLLYIALGMVALNTARPAKLRAAAWLAALLTFGHIVSVAITKSPWGVLSL